MAAPILWISTLLGFAVWPLRADDAYTAWSHEAKLPVTSPGLARVTLPADVVDGARPDLGDLRLLDPDGREVSYRLDRPSDAPETVVTPASFRAYVEPRHTRLEIGADGRASISAVILDVPTVDVVKRARVEGRQRGGLWRTLSEDAPLSARADARQTRLVIPPGVYEELRVYLDDGASAPLPVRGASLARPAAPARDLQTVGLRLVRREEGAGETRLVFALPGRNQWVHDLRLAASDGVFVRRLLVAEPCLVEPGAEGPSERLLAAGQVRRGPDGEDLGFAVGARLASSEIALTLRNDDSPPLGEVTATARLAPVVLLFRAETSGEHRLLFGQPLAAPPRYDLARLPALAEARAVRLAPSSASLRVGYQRPEPAPLLPALGAAFTADGWTRRARVTIDAAGIQRLELTPAVLSALSSGGRDLRLVRDGRQVPYLMEAAGPLRELEVTVEPRTDKRPGVSRWRIALPHSRLPLVRLTVACADRLFDREARVYEERTDELGERREWPLGRARWTRRSERIDGGLSLSLNAPQGNTLILEVEDGDNPPLTLRGGRVGFRTQRLYFKAAAPGELDLYFGNPNVGAPRYDIALVAGEVMAADKSEARLADPAPARSAGGLTWESSRARLLFWSILSLVVVALLAVVAKLLPENAANK